MSRGVVQSGRSNCGVGGTNAAPRLRPLEVSEFATIATALGLGGVLGALAKAGVDRATDFRNRMIGAADDFLEQVGATRASLNAAAGTLFEEDLKAILAGDQVDDVAGQESGAAVADRADDGVSVTEGSPHSTRRLVPDSRSSSTGVEQDAPFRDVERSLALYRERPELTTEEAIKGIDSGLAELRQRSKPGAASSQAEAEQILVRARAKLKLREAFEGLATIEATLPRLEVLFPARGRGASNAAVCARTIHAAVTAEWFGLTAVVEGIEDSAPDDAELEEASAAFTAEVNKAIRRWLI
jgi:hypothetical protein